MFRTPSRWIMAWIDGLDRLAAMHPGVIAVSRPSREEAPRRENVRSASLVSPGEGEVATPAEIALRYPPAYTELRPMAPLRGRSDVD